VRRTGRLPQALRVIAPFSDGCQLARGWHLTMRMRHDDLSCENCPCGRTARAAGIDCRFVDTNHAKGDVLFHEGDPAEKVLFIKSGTVLLERGNGPRAIRRAGAFVGLEALIQPRYADSARVTEPAVVCTATRQAIDEWMGAPGSPARMALEQTLRAEVEDTPRAASSDGTAVERVARWIIQEAGDQPVMRRDLAGLLGMVPETLSRALAKLAQSGAIELSRKHVKIKDNTVLETMAAR
jgi:CRP-like cAMP-binding protein